MEIVDRYTGGRRERTGKPASGTERTELRPGGKASAERAGGQKRTAEDSKQMVKATEEETEKMSVYTSRQRGRVEGTVVSMGSRECRRRAGRRNTGSS